MKLSKRLAAAFIAICMLLVSLPAFAANISIANDKMVLPTDGSAVAITSTGLGHANSSIGIVIDSASAAALGLQLSELPKTTTKTAGTNYDGLMISGTIKARNLTYVPGSTSGTAKNVREMFENNELVQFDFVDAYVKSLRSNNAGTAVVLEIAYQEYMDSVVPGTAKKLAEGKITGDETESVTFTEDDLYTLTDEECANLKALDQRSSGKADFYGAASDGILASNLTAKAGDDYKAYEVIDTGVFPEGTIFFSANKVVTSNKTASFNDISLRIAGYEGVPEMEGAYIAEESGTYIAYGLRTVYSQGNNHSRGAHAEINGVMCDFDGYASSYKPSSGYWAWDKSSANEVTLTKDALYIVKQSVEGESYSRLAAIALVPADKVSELGDDEEKITILNQTTLDMAHELTSNSYVAPPAITRTINVNGADYEVSSVDANAVFAPSVIDFDGAPVTGVTVADALVKAGVITADNHSDYLTKLTVKLNGIQIYNIDKMLVSEDDVIETSDITAIDVTNFAPVHVYPMYSTNGASSGGLKLCLSKKYISGYLPFSYDGTNFIVDAMKGAKLVGYLEVSKDITKSYTAAPYEGVTVTIPKGSKVYLNDMYYTGQVITSDTHGHVVMGLQHANEGTKPLHVVYPDGTIGAHPKYIQQSDFSWYNTYITNSNTKNAVDARYIETTGKWQLVTDGGKYVYILKYTVDENGKYVAAVSGEDKYLLVNQPVSLELKANERAVVWGYTPYESATVGGTSMIPLTGILANPAN